MQIDIEVIIRQVGDSLRVVALPLEDKNMNVVAGLEEKVSLCGYNKKIFSRVGSKIGGDIFLKARKADLYIGKVNFFMVTPIDQEYLETFTSAFRANLCFTPLYIDKSLFEFAKKFEERQTT